MTKMAERTNVKSPEDFIIFSMLLDSHGVTGEWSLDIFNGRYNECLNHIKSGGYWYFEVDYDIPDRMTAKFVMLS